jgi:hypothetical protein
MVGFGRGSGSRGGSEFRAPDTTGYVSTILLYIYFIVNFYCTYILLIYLMSFVIFYINLNFIFFSID